MNIFVAKLTPAITSEDLKDLFSEYGEVKSANVIMDRETNRSKCFGFVEMDNKEEALKAIEDLEGCEYDGNMIVVTEAKPRPDRKPRQQYSRR